MVKYKINLIFKNTNIKLNKIDNRQIEKYINDFLSLDNPTRELIINLIDKIYIYQYKQVDIVFNFNNKKGIILTEV